MTLRSPSVLALLALCLALPAASRATGTSDGVRCDPRSPAEWLTRCASSEGRREIEGLLPECRRMTTFGDVATVGRICEILAFGDGTSACDRAKRQLLALALNWASGRLGPGCCVEWQGRTVRLADVLDRHDQDCHAGRNCDDIRAFLAFVNDDANVHACRRDAPPPPPGGGGNGTDGCCTPRSKGFWHRQCLGLGLLTPGHGSGQGPGLHPAFSEAELRRILARADARVAGRGGSACRALDEENYRTARGRALAQYAALVLNHEAGLLDGCGRERLVGEVRRIERLLDAERWEEAKSEAERINLGQSVRRCGGHDPNEGGGDDEDGDEHGHDDDSDHGKGHGKGHEKGKGKGHEKHGD